MLKRSKKSLGIFPVEENDLIHLWSIQIIHDNTRMRSFPRHTKVIATIGPASESEEVIAKLLKSHVDVFRINMAHADHQWVKQITKRIRKVGREMNREPAVMMDVKGPEIRTGYLHDPVELKKNDSLDLIFVAQPSPPLIDGIWQIEVNYDKLPDHITPGDIILLDNGLIPLDVIHSSPTCIRCKVKQDAILKSRRHVNPTRNRDGASFPNRKR